MSGWARTTLILCLYGFLKELRPSEPFLTEYLIDPAHVNITLEEAYYDVYPVWTYSYLTVLVVVFMLTDFVRYKPAIVVEGLAYIATWCLLLLGSGVRLMQLMQFTYGVATSTEVAYYTYIYAKVDRKFYQRVTSFTRTSLLVGRFLSGVLAQVLTSARVMNFHQLNYFTLVSVSLATVVSLFLPPISKSIYFNNFQDLEESTQPLQTESASHHHLVQSKFKPAFEKVRKDFKDSFGNRYIFKWSLWWALGMCGNFQVGNYIQPLWETIQPVNYDQIEIYNGAVEAVSTLAGAVLAFAFGYTRFNWTLIGEPVLGIISILDGFILVWMATTENILVAYIGYWGFRALYQMLITVASYEVARQISDDSYGLVFGLNTFLALLFQTVLTVVVADDAGLALPPRTQFIVYGGFWFFTGIIFLAFFTMEIFYHGLDSFRERCRDGVWLAQDTEPNSNLETRIDVPVGSTEAQ